MNTNLTALPLKQIRDDITSRLLQKQLSPAEAIESYVERLDQALNSFVIDIYHKTHKISLLAVGGYGRKQLCPYSDLDLTLIDNHRRNLAETSSKLWYHIWDSGLSLDHSLRQKKQVISLLKQDIKVLLGILDARVIAGNSELGNEIIQEATSYWERYGYKFLDGLSKENQKRYELFGELAYLLEPDLKQSAGGLRDMAILRTLAKLDDSIKNMLGVRDMGTYESLILDVRVLQHTISMRENDRLLLQDQPEIASLLGYENENDLMKSMAEAGRAIQTTSDDAWRKINKTYNKKISFPAFESDNENVVLIDNEICIVDDAKTSLDIDLLLEVAVMAAKNDISISVPTLDRLQKETVPPSNTWSDRQRALFVEFCSYGSRFIKVAEALDQHRLFEILIPEWTYVRNLPQRNAYHKFTVDRHLLETVAQAQPLQSECERPDLLLIGALLHDIGKGRIIDHSELGASLAYTIASRLGFDSRDVTTIASLVKYHLVLPEVATRRDLDDVGTIRSVAQLLENKLTLHLLRALAEADGLATGTTAWGTWKKELVLLLVQKTEDALDKRYPNKPPDSANITRQVIPEVTHLTLQPRGKKLKVMAPDKPGLLAAVAGSLTLHGLQIKRAKISAPYPNIAMEEFDLEQEFEKQIDWLAIQKDINDALTKERDLQKLLNERNNSYQNYIRPQSAYTPSTKVNIDNITSDQFSIVEVRSPDYTGILYTITACLAEVNIDVASALVDTLGNEVIDIFYIQDEKGNKITDTKRLEELQTQIKEAIEKVYPN
jgi:[protein-PII] uridylyltransferase